MLEALELPEVSRQLLHLKASELFVTLQALQVSRAFPLLTPRIRLGLRVCDSPNHRGNPLLARNERPALIAKAFVEVDIGGEEGTTGILANTCERGPLEDESGTSVHELASRCRVDGGRHESQSCKDAKLHVDGILAMEEYREGLSIVLVPESEFIGNLGLLNCK